MGWNHQLDFSFSEINMTGSHLKIDAWKTIKLSFRDGFLKKAEASY